MKTHNQEFKDNIKRLGRQLDSIITYEQDGETIELGKEDLNSITPHYESSILKSVMRQLDIDSNEDIPLGTILNYQFGIKVRNNEVEDYRDNYDYVDYGNYVVYKSEKQEDTNSWKITCYDKMLYSMVDYESPKINGVAITYPITIRSYINAICSHLGLTFKNASDTFANYNREIASELYLSYNSDTQTYSSLGYTFRDVLDELAQVTASTICINEEDDELEIRYINNTGDTIDEEYLKDINVKFGEKYGPVNSIVLSRASESDSVYLRDEASVSTNGLCEIKIKENQIMNFNDRSDYLPDILYRLDGLEYYLNDFSSTGITYYNLCDRYNVSIEENTYSCVMFNDEVNVTQGLEENVFTELPEESETDYTKADKTDRKINQTYIIVDKQNQIIESVVSNVDEQNDKISRIEQTVDQIESQIIDIPTITTENSGTGSLFLNNLANTKLMNLKVHPTNKDILGLFASPLLKVSSGLKVLSRGITFDETSGDTKDQYYLIPKNLYFVNEIYDEFIYDGINEEMYIIHRIGINSNDEKYVLTEETREDLEYRDIIVEEGDYYVFMNTYPSAYIYVKAMIKNEYTNVFATSYEVDSKIEQTANQINAEVREKVDENEIIAKLNVAVEDGQGVINLVGNTVTIDSDDFKLDADGQIQATEGIIGGWNITDTSLWNYIIPPYDYTEDDVETIRQIVLQGLTPTQAELEKYDLNGDGQITILDLLICNKLIVYNLMHSNPGKVIFDTSDWFHPIKIINSNNEVLVALGPDGVYEREIEESDN